MCTCAPVSSAISKISRSAIVSVIGGRVRQCMIASVRPAARASAVSVSTSSWSSLWIATGSPVRAMAANAASMVAWSMRGKRTASYSYVESLNAEMPPAASSGIASTPPVLVMVPYSAISTCAVRSTQPILSASLPASVTGCGTSYGMSQQVVTPPAAALRVAPSIPIQPSADEVCMCPSTSPGRISRPV